MAKIEFYMGSAEKHIAVLDDGAVPRKGEFINIRRVTYRVSRVTWAVDYLDTPGRYPILRACVELTSTTAAAQDGGTDAQK